MNMNLAQRFGTQRLLSAGYLVADNDALKGLKAVTRGAWGKYRI